LSVTTAPPLILVEAAPPVASTVAPAAIFTVEREAVSPDSEIIVSAAASRCQRDGASIVEHAIHDQRSAAAHQDGNVTVKAFLVNHGEWRQAFGYRFETPDRIIVISGDTSPSHDTRADLMDLDLVSAVIVEGEIPLQTFCADSDVLFPRL
jgi:hypothetical protein